MSACTQAARHWWTRYRWVGSSAPTCRHCGALNPYYDPSRDPLPTGPDEYAQAAREQAR